MFESDDNRSDKDIIEGYYDERKQIIYLHAYTMLDAQCFVDHFEETFKKHEEKDPSSNFLSVYEDIKHSFSKILFILFYVSHIVVLSHRSCDFDINYIQYFKALDSLRHRLHWQINQVLKDTGKLTPDWVAAGRLCTPRLIFYFEHKPRHVKNLKKLEHNMEDRIYQILRRAKIVNNPTSLFSIPLNQEFVFISDDPVQDRLTYAVSKLMLSCQPGGSSPIQAPFCAENTTTRDFNKFLYVHIYHARVKGFNDVARSTTREASLRPVHFELPRLSQWAHASKAIYNLVMNADTMTLMNTDTRFSERTCEKVFPLAVARYQEGLPIHYTKAVHEARLKVTLNLFASEARGVKYNEYYEKLVTSCNDYWKDGRQICEFPSLTENPCTLPKHAEEKEHFSGAQYIAACDCGRIQRARDDPYSTKLANNTFYNLISKECRCLGLKRIFFPVVKPAAPSKKAAKKRSGKRTNTSQMVLQDEARALLPPTATKSLPAMLTASSPSGFLPEFSSWSLVCLGPASMYCHKIGLRESLQPGFISSTNYLLPWDVVFYHNAVHVPLEHQLDTHRSSKQHRKSSANTRRVPQFSVKIFVGIEYECPRGNRFMLAAPNRVLRASHGTFVKDTAKAIVESNMPLCFPCPCRATKPLTAQLMRIHIITPKAPVTVTVNPRVQPVTGGPIFTCTNEGPISLTQSTYWILRLPFVYTSDKKSYPQHHTGKLLHGLLAVKKIES